MEQHVKIVGVLDIVFGILGIIAGIAMIGMFLIGGASISTSAQQGAGGMAAAFAGIGLLGGIVVIAVSTLEVIVGVQLQQYKNWARIVQIIIAIISLPGFPVGTALGIYFLWAMLNQETVMLFEDRNSTMKRAA